MGYPTARSVPYLYKDTVSDPLDPRPSQGTGQLGMGYPVGYTISSRPVPVPQWFSHPHHIDYDSYFPANSLHMTSTTEFHRASKHPPQDTIARRLKNVSDVEMSQRRGSSKRAFSEIEADQEGDEQNLDSDIERERVKKNEGSGII